MKAETEFNYGRYLASREWALKKNAVRERSGGICERCKIRPAVNVHHQTYERIGREELTDLIDLCRQCHDFEHGKTETDPAAPRQLKAVEPGEAAILQRFSELADGLPTDPDAYATFNSQIQAVIVSLEKTNPGTAFQLAQIKLKANQKLYAAKRVLER